jgi:membrane protease YdiL (CAAX protease family)
VNLSDSPELPDPSDSAPPEFVPVIESPPPKPWPAWGFVDVIFLSVILALILFASIAVIPLAARLLPAFSHASAEDLRANAIVGIAIQSIAYLLWLGPIGIVIYSKTGEPFFKAIRWNWPRPQKLLLLIGVGIIVTAVLTLMSVLVPSPDDAPFEEYFKTRQAVIALAFFGILFAPFFEELFFRGLLYPAVRSRSRCSLALLFTAALFGLLHAPEWNMAWGPVLIIFFVGLVLTLIREFTQSLAASWIIHVVYNGLLMVGSFIESHGFTKLH